MKVIYKTCRTYEIEEVGTSIDFALKKLNFDLTIFTGKNVLLKPNLLGAYSPSKGVTTHPNFVEAVVMLMQRVGANVWVGDSPGFGYSTDKVFDVTGMKGVCDRTGALLKPFEKGAGQMVDGVLIAKPVLEADFVINLPKFKTHSLTLFTGAVKNLYGCVPGMQKVIYHREKINPADFGLLLALIADAVNPTLNIIDAIEIMDGNGPSGGRKRRMDCIVVGDDPFATDASLAEVLGLKWNMVEFISAAHDLGLYSPLASAEVLGDIPSSSNVGLLLPKTCSLNLRDFWLTKFILGRIWNGLSIVPRVDDRSCIKCGICATACPVKAISWEGKETFPMVMKKKCVGCFCCHELCPSRVIVLKESLVIRVASLISRLRG